MPGLRRSLLVLAVAGVASCTGGGEASQDAASPTAPEPTVTPEPTASPTPEAGELGETLTTPLGNEVTVYGWDTDVGRPIDPDPGNVFSQIEAMVCYTGTVTGGGGAISGVDVAFQFELEMSNSTRLSPEDTAYRNDELVMADAIREGDCARGFIVFQTPKEERPTFVLYQSTDETLRWQVRRA